MTAFPPLDVRLQGAKLSCVIDLRLGLSRWGLMFAWRVSEDMDVWLYPGFWELIDSTSLYLEDPEPLLGGAARGIGPGLDVEVACEALSQWEPARLQDNVPSFPFFYVGPSSYESHLPKTTTTDLLRRNGLLAEALHQRAVSHAGASSQHAEPQPDCWRDAAALAAALAHHRPLIFTVAEDPQQAPALCQFLHKCGIRCRKMAWNASENPMRRYLLPMLLRTGAAELIWAGLPLAAVHIVAPRAFTIPNPKDDDAPTLGKHFGMEPSPLPLDGDPWDGAVCIWYSLV